MEWPDCAIVGHPAASEEFPKLDDLLLGLMYADNSSWTFSYSETAFPQTAFTKCAFLECAMVFNHPPASVGLPSEQ
jgi:hypothetical protein